MSASATVLPERATHQQTRTFNQQLVLRALHDQSPLSRADLARLTGLTRTSVGDLVGGLIDDGLIEEVGRGRSSGGKSPILLRVAPDGRHLIGLDLGEAQFSGAVVNLRGEILRSIHLPLEGRNGDAAVELVVQLLDALRADDRSPLLGIGIGAPGVIDTSTGTVRWSVNLNWADLGLGPLLEQRYGVPVVVANDSHAAAFAELTFFRRPRPNNLIVIKVGRGVGAGIILNGQLFQGDGYGAGEFGHVSLGSADAPCRCGREGCLETMTSMRALVDAAGAVEPSIIDERSLVAAFVAGVPDIRRIVLDAARELGRRGRLADRRAQRSPRAARRPGRAVRRRLARRGPAPRPLERPGPARRRHADRVRPRPRRRGGAGRVGTAHGAAAGPGAGAMIATLGLGARAGRWSPASTSAEPRPRSSSSTIGTASLYEHVAPTDRSALVGQIAGLVEDARVDLGQDVAAVGVAIPGHVDPEDGSVSMAVNLGITHLPLGALLQRELGRPGLRRARRPRGRALAQRASRRRRRPRPRRASSSWRSGPGSRPASSSTACCCAATTALPARWATSPPIRSASSAHAACAAASRRSPPVRRSVARPPTRSRPVATPSCCPVRRPRTSSARRRPATPSRPRSSTGWPTTWPGRFVSLALTARRQASRHRRRRGGRRTRPSRSHPTPHRPRPRGLAARPGRPGRGDRRAAVANRGTRRTRGGRARAPPHRLA